MTRYGQIGWRMAAVAAFVGTAALAIVLTRAPAPSHAALSSAVTGRVCPTSGLHAWLGLGASHAEETGPGGHTVASTYYTLEFTNVSRRACSLYGYPEVSAYSDGQVTGSRFGGAAIRDTSVRPQQVMLAPGATAHAVLQVTVTRSTQSAGCAQMTAEELRVTLPRQLRSAFVPAHILVCSGQGRVSLSVQAIQARPGVPGYTMVP